LRPTLIIDEADTFLQGNEELRGILNAGYRRKTAYVVRVSHERSGGRNGSGGNTGRRGSRYSPRLARFSSWCPKIMASIGQLPETLAHRCIVIPMQRKGAGDSCERLRNMDLEQAGILRRCCARYVLDYAHEIAKHQPAIPSELNDRAADIWEPLFVLADMARGRWPQDAREAALALTTKAQEGGPTAELAADLLRCFEHRTPDRLLSRDLVQDLSGVGARPWREGLQASDLTPRWLSRCLSPHGVRPRNIRVGQEIGRGYCLEDVQQLLRE